MTAFRKTIAGAAAALTLAVGIAAASSPAEARWRHHRGWGAPVAAGVIGGLALGAIAAQAAAPRYYGPAYDYYPAYGACFNQRRAVYDAWGNFIGYRMARVCR